MPWLVCVFNLAWNSSSRMLCSAAVTLIMQMNRRKALVLSMLYVLVIIFAKGLLCSWEFATDLTAAAAACRHRKAWSLKYVCTYLRIYDVVRSASGQGQIVLQSRLSRLWSGLSTASVKKKGKSCLKKAKDCDASLTSHAMAILTSIEWYYWW